MNGSTPHLRDGTSAKISPISTVIFDLDGTLVDTAGDIANALQIALHSEKLPPMSIDHIRPYIGYGGTTLVEAALREAGTHADITLIQRLQATYAREYAQMPSRCSHIYPGVAKLLQRLCHRGIRLGVATNKLHGLARALLKALRIDAHFDCIVGSDTCGHRKPDPRVLCYVVREMNGFVDRTLMIGDTHLDVQMARAAGAFSCFVNFGYRAALSSGPRPDLVIADFGELESRLTAANFVLQRSSEQPRPRQAISGELPNIDLGIPQT
jgi:phosphoglycolate phosphatase